MFRRILRTLGGLLLVLLVVGSVYVARRQNLPPVVNKE